MFREDLSGVTFEQRVVQLESKPCRLGGGAFCSRLRDSKSRGQYHWNVVNKGESGKRQWKGAF